MNAEPKSADDPLGFEFDWLARDADDHVGLFSTAGGGYAPPEFLRDTDAHDAGIEAILALRASTTVRFAPQLRPGLTNTWRLVAERGLFAFDSDSHGGPYLLVAAPDTPALATELPPIVARVLENLQYRHLQFTALTTISSDSLLRQPHADRRFTYVVWFRDWSLPPDDQDHEWVAVFVVIAHTAVRAKEWGDELVRSYLTRQPGLELLRSSVTVAHAHTEEQVPKVVYGEYVPDDVIGW